MDKKHIDINKLYSLCNREQFFTCGDNTQYEKMFDVASQGITQMELAYIIYICSKYEFSYVYDKLTPLFTEENANEQY